MNDISYILPEMCGIREVSKRTGISYNALRLMCNNNEIAHIRCGKKILINLTKLAEMLNSINEQAVNNVGTD